jgi:receptor expression-enhancing protein 5/6
MEKLQAKFDELIGTVAEKTGQKEQHVKYAIIGLVVLILFFGLGGSIISKLVGFLYPAFESLKALETARGTDDSKWLTYWVVFSAFNFVEHFVEFIFGILPFYFLIKMCFFLWLYLPLTNGADMIYDKFVSPLFD